MQYVSHRVNTIVQLRQVPAEYGVEIDLRDRGERIILQHDPFGDGENFADWLKHYRHALLILNVKSERIEHRVLELVHEHGIENYFLLDCTFPMIRLLNNLDERRIAVRFSELEPIESALALAGQVDWCWIDCFTRMPLAPSTYERLKASFKLCACRPSCRAAPRRRSPTTRTNCSPIRWTPCVRSIRIRGGRRSNRQSRGRKKQATLCGSGPHENHPTSDRHSHRWRPAHRRAIGTVACAGNKRNRLAADRQTPAKRAATCPVESKQS